MPAILLGHARHWWTDLHACWRRVAEGGGAKAQQRPTSRAVKPGCATVPAAIEMPLPATAARRFWEIGNLTAKHEGLR